MQDQVVNVAATRAAASATLDPFAPLYRSDSRKFGFPPGTSMPDALSAALRAQAGRYQREAPRDEALLSLALALCDRLLEHRLIPQQVLEDHLWELQWARVRCLFRGLGYAYHAPWPAGSRP